MGWPDDRDLPIEVHAAFGADLTADPGTWSWTDLSDRLTNAPIHIRVPAAQFSPATGSLMLLNDDGALTPLHPMSPYWPNVLRNTPLRVRLRRVEDAFGRTLSSDWGTADSGQVWSGYGSGGTVLTTDQTVSGGRGRQSVPVAVAYRTMWLPDLSLLDCQVHLSGVSLPVTDVIGGSVEPGNILLRAQSLTTYYLARVEITTAESVLCKLYNPAGALLASATVPGLTHSAAQTLEVVADITGSTLSMKVWATSGTEPAGWAVTATDDSLALPGGIGVRTGVAAGNTNTKPVVASYDSITVYVDRLNGFADQWEPTFLPTTTPGEAHSAVRVTASGILRRLGQGTRPLRSALYRAITRANPTAYWSLEDGEGALSAASAVANVDAMQTFGFSRFTAPGTGEPVAAAGLPKFGTGNGIPGSAPVVDLAQGGVLAGVVPAGSGGWRFEFVMVAPRDKASARIPIRWTTDGTFPAWELQIESTGLFATFRTSVGAGSSGSATATFNVFDGLPHHYQLEAFQSGGSVDARIYVDDLLVAVFGGTLTGSPGSVRAVTINPGEEVNGVESMPELGHVPVWNQPYSGLTNTAVAMLGHAGEPATDRIARLCAEEGVSLSMPSVPAEASTGMGPQRMLVFGDLLRECVDADLGVLYESGFGLGYLPRASRYNKPVDVTIDLAEYKVASGGSGDVLVPAYDDQDVRNEWTVTHAISGASETVADAEHQAANGVYADSIELNLA